MFKSLTVKPLLWTILALTLALGTMTLLWHGRGSTIDGLEAQVEASAKVQKQAEANLSAAVATNQNQKAIINDLALRYSNLVGQKQAVDEANARAVAARDAAVAARNRATNELNRLKETIYATDATCAAWGSQPVCPAISDQLQLQWGNDPGAGDRNPTGGSPGPAAQGSRPEPAGSAEPAAGADTGHPVRAEMQPQGRLLFEPAARAHADRSIAGLPRQRG